MNKPFTVFQKLEVSIAYSAVKDTVAKEFEAIPVFDLSLYVI